MSGLLAVLTSNIGWNTEEARNGFDHAPLAPGINKVEALTRARM